MRRRVKAGQHICSGNACSHYPTDVGYCIPISTNSRKQDEAAEEVSVSDVSSESKSDALIKGEQPGTDPPSTSSTDTSVNSDSDSNSSSGSNSSSSSSSDSSTTDSSTDAHEQEASKGQALKVAPPKKPHKKAVSELEQVNVPSTAAATAASPQVLSSPSLPSSTSTSTSEPEDFYPSMDEARIVVGGLVLLMAVLMFIAYYFKHFRKGIARNHSMA